jgi:hypothetical protein
MALFALKSKEAPDQGPVIHIDGSPLARPTRIPLPFKAIMALFVIAAGILGGVALSKVSDEILNAPVREAEAVQENISRQVPLELPLLKDLIQLDDATISDIFTNQMGLTLYNLNNVEGSEGSGLDVIKLPSTVTSSEAILMYSKGVSKLSASSAAKLLNGSWRMTVGRAGYTDMKVKYADFTSGDAQTALNNAIVAEGLAETAFGESGVDSANNTYQRGTIDINGTIYSWQVSVCPLSEVYSVSGLPASSQYVGIHLW